MSTRCQIGFYPYEDTPLEKWDALIYRHFDGYPDGVLPDIVPILKDFNKNRGLDDTEYASAWLVAKLKDDYLNIGVSNQFHGDIEYYYAVYPNRIEVYEPISFSNWLGGDCETDNLRLIQTVEI